MSDSTCANQFIPPVTICAIWRSGTFWLVSRGRLSDKEFPPELPRGTGTRVSSILGIFTPAAAGGTLLITGEVIELVLALVGTLAIGVVIAA